jgi:hypothetical protein
MNKPAKVASHVPGRLRLKLHPQGRDRAAMDNLQTQLQSLPGIDNVRLNPAAGSLTVHYDRTHHSMAGILRFLEDLDVVVDSIAHLPSLDNGTEGNRNGGPQPEFITAINALNQRLRNTTGLPIDLKQLLPLAFAGAGLWSIARRGLMIDRVPGWLLLWFAFDIFVKLHSERDNRPATVLPDTSASSTDGSA